MRLAAAGAMALRRHWATALRLALIVAAVALVFSLAAGDARADAQWPAFNPAPTGPGFRGPGNYLSWIKIALAWLLFLFWVGTTDWVSTDAQDLKLDYQRWNPVVFGTFFGAFVLLWLLPISFWILFPLLFITWVAPLTTYIIHRNGTVDNNLRVMTPEHLRYWFATKLNAMGMKLDVEKRDPHELGPPVKVFARGAADEPSNNARLLMARQSPGLRTAREILADALAGRATKIMLDYTQEATGVRTMIDGVWIPWEPRTREAGDPALESLKLLCGLNPQDRQNRQEGTFLAEYDSKKYPAIFVSQGTATGERILIQFEEQKIHFKSLDELGMRTKLQEQLREVLAAPQGFVLFSAMPENGLRSTMDVALHSCDRFTREFSALEEETNPYTQVENVAVTTYKAADGLSPANVLPKFFRTEPNVAVVRDLVDAATVEILCEQIAEGRLIISAIRAKDSAEALLRVVALGIEPQQFAQSVTAVVNLRLIRKLCESCKEAYAPTPQILQQLGIPEGRVQAFYRPPQPNADEPKEPCQVCGGIGYLGRTAIFELLVVGDTVRRVLSSNPKLDLLRQAARRDGMSSLQEEGVLLVAKGVTSLPELQRVLKQ
jgi:type II secretory ATPase GspE/PulE/Tfp pilus assembly ATPase PilB-like protein